MSEIQLPLCEFIEQIYRPVCASDISFIVRHIDQCNDMVERCTTVEFDNRASAQSFKIFKFRQRVLPRNRRSSFRFCGLSRTAPLGTSGSDGPARHQNYLSMPELKPLPINALD